MMAVLNSSSEKLYSKVLNINVKGLASDDIRVQRLTLNLEWLPGSSSSHKKILAIHLTDSNDPFFYYMAGINEDDFLTLKHKQDLLVDFLSFPKMFIDLLELCILEDTKPQPKFILSLYIDKSSELPKTSVLDIVEKNPFKHIVHLSLILPEVSSVVQQQYITTCYRNIKEEKERLESRLHSIEEDLTKQLQNCQQTNSAKILELTKSLSMKEAELNEKERKFKEDMRKVKDEVLKKQKEEVRKWENFSKEKEESHKRNIHHLEAKIKCLEMVDKEQSEKLRQYEKTIKELQTRLDSVEQDASKLQECLRDVEKENANLQFQMTEKQLKINKLSKDNSVLQQAEAENADTILMLKQKLDIVLKEKDSLELKCSQLMTQYEKKEQMEQSLRVDLAKVNDVIRKLQAEIKDAHDKLKHKKKLILKQQDTVSKKTELCKKLTEELAGERQRVQQQEQEMKVFLNKFGSMEKRLKECENDILIKEKIIRHLDDQLLRQKFAPNIDLSSNAANSNKCQETSCSTNSTPGIRNSSIPGVQLPACCGPAIRCSHPATENTSASRLPSDRYLDLRYLPKRNVLQQNAAEDDDDSFLQELYADNVDPRVHQTQSSSAQNVIPQAHNATSNIYSNCNNDRNTSVSSESHKNRCSSNSQHQTPT